MSAEIVKNYVHYRLSKSGYARNPDGSDSPPGAVQRSLRVMGDEFQAAYSNAFEDMTGVINVHGQDLKDVFYTILDSTFEDGVVNWGRIVGLFVFSSMVAVKSMACNRTDVVENVMEWTTDYLQQDKLSHFINAHGGWDGFVQFHRNPKIHNRDDILWNKARSSFGYIFAGVASVANILMH